MTCQQCLASLSSYLDEKLGKPEMNSVTEHLRACPACREEAEALRTMIGALGRLPDAELPPHFHERLHASLMAERRRKEGMTVKNKLRLPVLSAVAAGLLVLVLGGAALLGGGDLSPMRLGTYDKDDAQTQDNSFAGNDGEIRTETEQGGGIAAAPSAPGAPEDEKSLVSGDSAESPDSREESLVSDGRKIIYTAQVGANTRQFDADVAGIRQACEAAGGYVESVYIQGVAFNQPGGTGRTATIVVRIPQTAYEGYMTQVTGIGQTTSDYEYTQDITADYFDSEIRLGSLQIQLDRLEEILRKAEKMEDIVLLVQEISNVTNQIEQIKGQLRVWDNLIKDARVTIMLTEVQELTAIEPADPTLGDRIAVAFYGTLNAMKRGMQTFIVWLVSAAPWLIVIVALALIAAAITVPLVRRRRRAGEDTPIETEKE